jgi:RNAse (barnase) inhibitor barstar
VTKRKPASLSDLPEQVVAARCPVDVETLRIWAREAGQRFVLTDLAACDGSRAVLEELGRAFAFPEWFGANLDALGDCLTDLIESDPNGLVAVLDHLPRGPSLGEADRKWLLEVFRDALESFADAGVPLRVYYR